MSCTKWSGKMFRYCARGGQTVTNTKPDHKVRGDICKHCKSIKKVIRSDERQVGVKDKNRGMLTGHVYREVCLG